MDAYYLLLRVIVFGPYNTIDGRQAIKPQPVKTIPGCSPMDACIFSSVSSHWANTRLRPWISVIMRNVADACHTHCLRRGKQQKKNQNRV